MNALPSQPARVLLVDSQALFRQGVRCLLSRHNEFQVIGETAEKADLLNLVQRKKPDIILTDLFLPRFTACELSDLISRHEPIVHVIILTEKMSVTCVKAALKSRIRGYFLKTEPFEVLLAGMKEVLAGRTSYASEVNNLLPEICMEMGSRRASEYSTRELEIIRLVAEGMKVVEVAQSLGISAKTVESHRANIFRKTGLRGTAAYMRYAIENGLVNVRSVANISVA